MVEDLIGYVMNDRYRLTRWIHSSATGDVFEATDQKLFGQAVAIKLLNQAIPGNVALSGYLRRRFEEEARISIQLGGHPHIAQVKDFDLEGGRPFLVMELLGAPPLMGRHLGELLETSGPLALERFLKLSQQICSALHYAHGFQGQIDGTPVRGVIHRDIKPANIFVVQDPVLGESAKVLDFGIAKLISDVTINMGSNLFGFVGTLSHASPEQLQGKPLDPRTDIYSLGIVLYQMVSGQLPLRAETDTFPGWYEAHSFQSPRPLSSLDLPQKIPPALETLLLSCLAKKPEQRPKTMQILSHQLQLSLRPRSSLTSASVSAAAPPTPRRPNPTLESPSVRSDPTPTQALPIRPSPTPAPNPRSRREFVRPQRRPIIPRLGREGRYRVEEHLGSGGMGEVYLATDTHLNRQVAVKIMTGNASEDPHVLVKRFKREVEVCASLNSPHIVQVSDFGTTEHEGGYPFFVMEYLQGQTLGQLLAREKKLPLERSLQIMAQVCSGLSEAHNHNIVHRDLKPDNIFLIPGTLWELVKILDFGVAKVMNQDEETSTKLTMVGAFLGTLCYASPEQCGAQAEITLSTDIYSLGVILYEMLSGTNPFNLEITTARDNFLWIDAHVHTQPIPLNQQPGCEDLPEVITAAVMRCLQKSPGERFAAVDDLMAILQSTLRDTHLMGRTTAQHRSRSAPEPQTSSPTRPASDPSQKVIHHPSPTVTAPTQPSRALNPDARNTAATVSINYPAPTQDDQTIKIIAEPQQQNTPETVITPNPPSNTPETVITPNPLSNTPETVITPNPLSNTPETVITPNPLSNTPETVITPNPSIDETVVEPRQTDQHSSETWVEFQKLNTPETLIEDQKHSQQPQSTPHQAQSPSMVPTDIDLLEVNIDPEPTGPISRRSFDRAFMGPPPPTARPSRNEVPSPQSARAMANHPDLFEDDDDEDWDDDEHEEDYLVWQDPDLREQSIEKEISQINHLINPPVGSQPVSAQTDPKATAKLSLWPYLIIGIIVVATGGAIYWGIHQTLDTQEDSTSQHPCSNFRICSDRRS